MRKQRLYVFQRKEISILFSIGLLIAAFTFTLGLHYGKQLGTEGSYSEYEMGEIKAEMDTLPNTEELSHPGSESSQIIQDSLNKQLHDEITRTGIKLSVPIPTQLPTVTKSKNEGETTLEQNEKHKEIHHDKSH